MSLHQILLQPTDVLFFRDGRPMGGSLAGHTAAWPLPDVTNHALHAALHRAGLDGVHEHCRGRSGEYSDQRDRKFGSLVTAGPFPVNGSCQWFFPRPKDAQRGGSVKVTLRPVRSLTKNGDDDPWNTSSLPDPLEYAVVNTEPPTKDVGGEPWISAKAFEAYLKGKDFNLAEPGGHLLKDDDIAVREHQIGIGIDPETQSQDGKNFYSAHYLRLRESVRLGLFAEAMDKDFKLHDGDLIKALINGHPERIIVGGQQRICSATRDDVTRALPLPRGAQASADFTELPNGKFAVKWVLLTPAIWPEISSKKKAGSVQNPHPGGWLPNWIDPRNGSVCLKAGGSDRAKREARKDWRERVRALTPISARLVAAIVPKPIPVTGWSMGLPDSKSEIGNQKSEIHGAGAKSTQLAVPAGAVYYFEAESAEDAANLAAALNWHGKEDNPAMIKNRRSTLMGEKGFGLGVCGTWKYHGES